MLEFRWDDPSDTAPVNRNSRGTWHGITAQELIGVMPWLVNAEARTCPNCMAGHVCSAHRSTWQVDWEYGVPISFKAIQELNGRVKALEAEVQYLKSKAG